MEQIKFNDIDLAFGNNVIVESFNLSINKGEIVTFFGPSGCGKSSIMKLVLGINTPKSGSVTIGGVEAAEFKSPISYVPQDNDLLPWLSVKENIEIWSKNTANTSLSSAEVLELVNMSNHSQKLPSMLSGGMSRRTALARGLAIKSDILCFDEAMVGIEKTIRHKLLLKLRNYIKKNEVTAIFISHDYEETIVLSDRIIAFSPPPTVISKQINVTNLANSSDRDDSFTSSLLFKEVYNQMMSIL
ncbi:iron(III) transport system ATP-binding protein/NitT/TauT family transport system ATP-binding protein/putative spermidine/putrescine transport system ATP-binding protein [Flexibacter flexilis DSM 6793]|uniref:Iron(III) transport system ATP-binding protein/NitT/TauT family transport system ATP-binding protein/putative spermidine/putrescine transport system ATP-binding protein n=1 Tax=Flexibacter flexilis DSM 6793 TaxID=927664 RepID=A0A1I1N849_9BACT|nr:ATP-binding cassette domain-containing protein [Flexibacter flexilis]SFC93894.1 iron(III) transport system ATP-binding protein/NitT/TauT family transport system ATP-binding protein/putative spermidine/putrescine transport system ATP-binding protein [Flexibacter flexilis DSM 6793]